jgi:iron complex transport system substrate-binding protein
MDTAPRIVSLAPAGTEMLYALGADSRLVGVSHACDFPYEARAKPSLTRSLIDDNLTSEQIDQQVRSRLEQGLPLFEIDIAQLEALRPTLVLAQSQCSVCAVDTDQVSRLRLPNVNVFAHGAQNLDEMLSEIERLASRLTALNSPFEKGAVNRLRLRAAALEDANRGACRPRVLVIEWLAPLMAAGNWTPDLVERAGGQSLLAGVGSKSPYIQWSEIAAADPDVIFIVPCGFDLDRTRRESNSLRELPHWHSLRAVRNGRVFLSEGNTMFHRCGPRLLETLEFLRAALNDDEKTLLRFSGVAERWT